MKKKNFSNFIISAIGIIYAMYAFHPLIKTLFNKRNVNNVCKEDWIEIPLLIEK